MRQSIRKSQEDGNISQIPVNCEDTPVLPNEYQITKSREPFLMFDSGEEDPEGMLILDSETGIGFSSESDNCFSNGTFKVCPEIFIQLYTVHAQQREKISHVSLVYYKTKLKQCTSDFIVNIALNMQDYGFSVTCILPYLMKCEDFNGICWLGNDRDDILVDFERTATNAMQHLNQNIEIKSCFYNLSSNVWERIH